MVDYREILRLRSLGNNITQIANAIHSSRHTVRDIEKLADEKGICWPLGEELTNQKLYSLLYPERLENHRYTWSQTVPTSIVNWQKKAST